MRFLFLGDVVGNVGRDMVCDKLPGLITKYKLDFVVVNGENAAGGFGITEKIYNQLISAGCDVVTTGNHVFDQKEALIFASRHERFLRPVNYPLGTPGKGANIYTAKNGARILVANIMGRVFMHPDLDDPFAAAEQLIANCILGEEVDAIIFDFHAEATSEKQCFAHFLDGRVSVVVGTHTHIPTADAQILKYGTAYITDAGMCGDYDSSLGMEKEEPINRFVGKIVRKRYEAAKGPATLSGLCVEICDNTGLAKYVAPIRIGAHLQEARPLIWEE
ncbi:TIGR00282 family metallophosphoesterase [Bartonella sp. TP]|uniref:TIGR00282 family metallophosphoesterase n=1 Tax=Bartonella sp. TP TaxID=3057550 RepID=UPI0025B24C08|nr:TIGR00282 family metallophosphoesterase [Bartonella sp. TP]WJW79593.1 TIGR00282 family metallophosphoesterase [Bartonella sp. TP]